MTLRKLTAKKRSEVAEMLADYWAERGMPEYDVKWAEEYLKEGHRKEVKSDEFFVYTENGRFIGAVSLIIDVSNVAEIRDFAVKKEYRGKGYGKKMLTELITLARKEKIRKLFALTFKPDLFKSAGFQREGVLKNHFAKGEHMTVMSKFLQ